MVLLEYIWIDGYGNLRSKTKVYNKSNIKIDDLPEWNYDGSSTNQADGNNSEVILKPVSIYDDPFRKSGNNLLVLCETYTKDGKPHISNTRLKANNLFEKNKELMPLFGIEQEFFITKNGKPIWDEKSKTQGDYYCGLGGDNVIGREMIEKAFDNCLYTGLNLTGLNAEVAPSQWEFQVCAEGIKASDQLYIMRYILLRTAEEYGYSIDFNPKPLKGEWNGSGCHTNFSTKEMREENGYGKIIESIKKLEKNHIKHMNNYGEGNKERMSGLYETSNYDDFSYGVADRTSSIRIPKSTYENKKGYFEDRRPASNMDPYIVTSLIFETSCL